MSEIGEKLELYTQLREELRGKVKDALLELLKALFAKYPNLVGIRWKQGTPSFNDGDPCTFGLYGIDFRLAELPEDRDEDDDEVYAEDDWVDYENLYSERSKFDAKLLEDIGEFHSALYELEEFLDGAFDGDSTVTINRQLVVVIDGYDVY